MKVIAILNRDGGTFRTLDMPAFAEATREVFARAGHDLDARIVSGPELIGALDEASSASGHDVMLAGGGDGTVSAAAAIAFRNGKPLGILPAGTMNMFARVLKIPLELNDAVAALAQGHVGPADIGTVDDRTFVHQVSVGLHPRFVRVRNERPFQSKFGKIRASVGALFHAIADPPRFPVRITLDGETTQMNLLSVSISNNRYGDSPLPFAERADGGVLGVYTTRPLRPGPLIRLTADMLFGTWRSNRDLEETLTDRVALEFPTLPERANFVIDGELVPMSPRAEFRIHPGALQVLYPNVPAA
ncbi:diacylglycerol/lipid kinase family protein [Paroceanicella profunda]|uniref:diacylglycerol/lipid kinase family protein n=1 Tax=Paroceanicella profunda TaxID=2579971 RepID=UPI00147871DA|nr:diacylglycerol kinase family protein [Paroceanicella profunda]